MADNIEQTVRKAIVEGTITEREMVDFLKAMKLVKSDTGFGVITCELKHGGVSIIEVKLFWKPTGTTEANKI